jgi:metal-responsive CopG/Arc/MetJ family transcriptional regulator
MENAPLKRYINVLLEETLIADIDDFKFEKRLPNRTEAIRFLLTTALNEQPRKTSKTKRQ